MEFALVLPVFLLILMSLFDAGRVIYAQNAITGAARDAVRLAAVSPGYTTAKYAAIRKLAQDAAVGVTITTTSIKGESVTCPAGQADATVPGTCFYPANVTAGSRIVVKVSVVVPLITPIIAAILSPFTLSSTSEGLIQCTGC